MKLWSPIVAPSYPRGSWFEQTWISTISGSFHINISFPGPVVLEKKIFKWHHPIFAFSWLSPLWRGRGPSFEQTWSPFTQGWCVPSLVEFGPAVLEKKSKMWKVNRQTDGRTDNGQKAIRKAHLSLQLRWAKQEAHGPTSLTWVTLDFTLYIRKL